MNATNLAGLLVYRISQRRPTEYLLLHDSYEHQRHWYPPKGRKVGDEDDLRCAVRETVDLTGLSADDLITDDAFRAELQYVDGIKPKKVVYILARLSDQTRHNSLNCYGSGMRYDWCSLDQALEKVVFKSMQDILTQADDYIESIRGEILASTASRSSWQTVTEETYRRHRRHHDNNGNGNYNSGNSGGNGYVGSNGNGNGQAEGGADAWRTVQGVENRFRNLTMDGQRAGGRVPTNDRDQYHQQQAGNQWRDHPSAGQQQQQQQRRPQDNPLYKTKMCDKYQRDGECPYGIKCVFAHGEHELRSREVTPSNDGGMRPDERQREGMFQQRMMQHQQPLQSQQPYQGPPGLQNAYRAQKPANPLYKTQMCQRFTELGECPYGEKCQFAHGQAELRKVPEQLRRGPRDGNTTRDQMPQQQQQQQQQQQRTVNQGFHRGTANRVQSWRSGGAGNSEQDAHGHSHNDRYQARDQSWGGSNAGPRGHTQSPGISENGSLEDAHYTPSAQSPKDSIDNDGEFAAPHAAPLVTPVPQTITNASAKPSAEPKTGNFKNNGDSARPWIKVVEASDKELEKMSSSEQLAKVKQANKQAGQEMRATRELADVLNRAPEPSMHDMFKEITHIEFRYSLTKQQLLNTVITGLFAPCNAMGVSEQVGKRAELLKKVVTKKQDQMLMLNAWVRLFNDDANAAAWQKRASEVLGALYEASLVEEDAFTEWFEGKNSSDCSAGVAAMKPFSHWLATAEEE